MHWKAYSHEVEDLNLREQTNAKILFDSGYFCTGTLRPGLEEHGGSGVSADITIEAAQKVKALSGLFEAAIQHRDCPSE